MLIRIRRSILVRDGSGQIHTLYPGDHWRRIKQGSIWMHDFLVGDDGFGYENPGPGQFSQPSPVQEIVAPAWQLQLVSRAWDDAEIDRRIAEAQRLCGIPWEPGENCQDNLSRVTTGRSGSFQRDGIVGLGLVVAGLFVAGNLLADSGR
jgi:hypothetical protein